MIVGPTDHGKSTLAQILTAYAARLDRSPILADLDVGQSFCSISGAISAIPVEKINLSAEVSLLSFLALLGLIACILIGGTRKYQSLDLLLRT